MPTSSARSPRRVWPAALGLAAVLAAGAAAQPSVLQHRDPAQPQDEEFARLVREWTTRSEFLSPLVDHLPAAPGVPTPKEVLGYHIGAPKKLTYYADILRYYRTLASRTPRVKVLSIGRTDEDREIVTVFVSSEANIRDLERYRADLARLADPRGLSDAEARAVIARAKPIYHLLAGLHSAETGHPEMLMELAYRLAVENSPLVRQIRDQVIVSLTPVAEPDGRDRYVDWYYRHLVDIDREEDRPGGPPYWGKYVFHDNNRDINYSQVTMRALLEWYMQWHPPILHELHESIPFLYTYSGQAPQNPNYDPILFGELPWFANFEMAQLTKYGMPGVWTHAFMDAWSPGYLGSMAYNHNGMMRMYEVFGNGGATTMKRRVGRESGEGGAGGGQNQTTREWYRPLPPYREVEWSMRNNINYAQTGVLTALQLASTFPHVVLENFYLKSRNSIQAGLAAPPHGYVIPGDQADPTRVAFIVNILRLQGIEVGRARGELVLKEGRFPAGSFVIKAGQPYWRLAKILLERQVYPDPNLRTYDDSGWTMGLMAHADVREIADRAILDAPVDPVSEYRPEGRITGTGPILVVAHNGSNSLVTLRYRLASLRMRAAERSFDLDGRTFPAGSFLIEAGDAAAEARRVAESLGLSGAAVARAPEVPAHDLDLPRLAVYSTWGSTQEVGWVRHAFDRFGVKYDLIFKERVRRGNLRADYDVIVIPNQGQGSRTIVDDVPNRGRPLAYTRTDRFRFLGMYGESEDITGGIGLEGVLELQRFLDGGGLLVTLGTASYFPAEYGLARDVEVSRPSAQFYAPRPIVEAEILRPGHPVFYGYRERKIPVKYLNGPLITLQRSSEADERALMRYVGGEAGVLSGLMRNPNEVRNRPAIVDVRAGRGRVLMFATNPIYRWQNWGEFNMVFNALLNFNDLDAAARPVTTSAAP
ncbi:MAG TPA: M14 family zinc carboxypeptidase [Vicinamibacterales bacterium]|nr:M14 family zinc carboxypeptidase [Vicinamibacterales bacterium]